MADLFKTVGGKRIKKTPEEIAQEQQGGREFIAEIGKAAESGASPMLARQQAQQAMAVTPEALAIQEQNKTALQNFNLQTEINRLGQPSQTTQQPQITQPQPSNQEIQQPIQQTPQKQGVLEHFLFGSKTVTDLATGKQVPFQQNIVPLPIAGIGSLGGIGMAAEAAAAPTAVSTAASIGSNVSKLSFLTKGFSIRAIATLGGAGFLLNKKVSEANSILVSSLSEKERIITEVENNRMTYGLAQQYFNEINQNINRAENSMKFWSGIDVFKFMGFMDSLTNYEAARRTTNPSLDLKLAEADLKARTNIAKQNLGIK